MKSAGLGSSWVIEGWRGLAACMVVFAHYGVVPGASWAVSRFTFTGVDLFFVLSGFVFAPYFFGKQVAWRGFAIKRFFRIYPAYFLAANVWMLPGGWEVIIFNGPGQVGL